MPSKSEKQKNFFGAVMGAKKGQQGVSGEAKKVAKKMPKKKIKKFLKTEEEELTESNTIKDDGLKTYSFRHPKIKQEKKKYYDSKDQGVKVRDKRKPPNLPDDWDDKNYSMAAKKMNKTKKPSRNTIRKKEEEEQSVLKKMKKGGGKATFEGPNVKERKPFAPPTQTHKSKKGKGSYDRKKPHSEDNENPCWKGYEMVGMKNKNGKEVPNCVPVKESTSIIKFLEAIMSNNHAEAHKHLKNTINKKIQDKIVQEIETPLF
jgi:hypothetical protein